MSIKKVVVLLSGGIDSSTIVAIAKHEGYEVYALSFDYNQRHWIELRAAKEVALALQVKEHLVMKFNLKKIGNSALTSNIEIPKTLPHVSIPITYVPARNTIFLSFALAWAEILEVSDIFIGANAVDYSGYPDCRCEYLKAFEKMANLATKASVEEKIKFNIKAPLLYMTKAEIIRKGIKLGFDYSLTWSCYDPQFVNRQFIACNRCDSCLFRGKGFREIEKGGKNESSR